MMKSNTILSLALSLIGSNTVFSQSKPNVLYIMTDQQSYNMMSCMGNKWLSTPNMDEIASKGYRFEKTYCVNPVCMPSRFSLLTGHYGSEIGVKENTITGSTVKNAALKGGSNEDTTLFDGSKRRKIVSQGALGLLFQNAGYETHYSGKTHLYGTKNLTDYGFQLNGFNPYDGPANYAVEALAKIGSAKQAKPFFMFLSFLNPHDICLKAGADKRFPGNLSETLAHETLKMLALQKSLSPEEYRKQIPPRAPNPQPINGEQLAMVSLDVASRAWDDKQWDLYNWMYHRLTESVDEQIGRVLTALKKAGLEKNTIIVFTSDHGEMHGAHGLTFKNVMFEECQRVPLIFVGKGIKPNYSDKSTLVCNGLDFLPTICDLVGIQYPKGLAGVSLKPYLTGQGPKPDRKYIITEDYNGFQINDGRYKYTIYELPGFPEMLTDLQTNPGETINYATNPSYNEIKATLKKELMADLSKRGLTPLKAKKTTDKIPVLD